MPLVSLPAGAALPTAVLSGTITVPPGQTLEGTVRLHAGDARTGAVYSSEALGADRTFEIQNLPASSYRLAVETGAGLYVVEAPLRLEAGATRTIQVAIRPQPPSAIGRANAAVKQGQGQGQGRPTFWSNPLTATLLVIGAAVVVGVIVDQATKNESSASPSSP